MSEPDKPLLDRILDEIAPPGLPRWILRIAVLKFISSIHRMGLLRRSDRDVLRETRPGSTYVPTARTASPEVMAGYLDKELRLTLNSLIDQAFPQNKPPTKENLKALHNLAKARGYRGKDVNSFLMELLDTRTLESLGLIDKRKS